MSTDLTAFLARHERVALMLSAGKDSGACLKMLRPHLAKVMVIWVNPGNPFPETVEYMSRIQRSVPHFQMAIGHQPKFISEHGYPADIVPFEATEVGRALTHSTGPRLVSLEQCCYHNLWEPMQRAIHDCGATGCIRGDKACDLMHGGIPNGGSYAGVEYLYPVWDWSNEQVRDYMGEDMPPSYARGRPSSLDCMNCTAYLAENSGRLADLRDHYPTVYAEVAPVVHWMRDVTKRHLAAMEAEA